MKQLLVRTLMGSSIVAGTGFLQGCVERERPAPRERVVVDEPAPGPDEEVVTEAPPAEREEVIVERDRHPGEFWVRGHYIRRYHHWDWVPGHWARAPHEGAVWVEGRGWYRGPGGWHFEEGHWR